MPLPMHVGRAEGERFERLFAAIEERGSQQARDEASLMRLQLSRHAQYVRACAKLESFSDALREDGSPLVPLQFPMQLTKGTRESVKAGVYRSFLRFLQDLHELVLSQHGHRMDDACTDVPALLTTLAGTLTLQTCHVLDQTTTHCAATRAVIAHVERCRVAAVREESKALLDIGRACEVIVNVLRDFGRTMAWIAENKAAARLRAFLSTAERKGLRKSGTLLRRVRHLSLGLEQHAWMEHAGTLDDAQLVATWQLLKETHRPLADSLTWQERRVRWLIATTSSNQCWCGLALECGLVGELVNAPAHMLSFATGSRVRVVREEDMAQFTCHLTAACVANLLEELLREHHLVLNRISTSYAARIVTFDFCKYEKMARHFLDDCVRPWEERESVYYVE